jgi:uncharacterized membrane protein YeaQ/YmgE (transglycosylase-associated protein family)
MVEQKRQLAAAQSFLRRVLLGIIAWLIFGLIAGAVAQLIVPGNDPGGSGGLGILITIILGIVGAFIGGFIGAALGFGGVTSFDIRSFIVAVIGAIILLVIWRMVRGGTHRYA